MNDEQMQSVLDEWFEDTDPQPPNARRTATNVMARVPQTRQRGRWLPFRLFRPKAQTPTATDTSEYQPSPIPASNGHTPTVIGRTQSMLSPVKAITAGAIVFAIGGVMLVAQPFQQQGSTAPGAAVDVAPAWVSGTIGFTTSCTGPTHSEGEVAKQERDHRCSGQTWTADDERLSGKADIAWNADVYEFAGGEVKSVAASLIDLQNDAGDWRCRSDDQLAEGSGRTITGLETVTCVGGGGYEGLTAILNIDWASDGATFEGIVSPTGAPSPPDPSAAE